MFVFIIKDLREERGITLKQLAEKTGLNKEYLKQLENNEIHDAPYSTLFKIASELGISVQNLYYTVEDYEKLRKEMHTHINKCGVNSKEAKRISCILDMLQNFMYK